MYAKLQQLGLLFDFPETSSIDEKRSVELIGTETLSILSC